ncbi:hypothetical protein [Cereibacter sediminicola]|uniref:hypothetical protein n=1 Tax=Cereibacter sediminicola TaxID=2584941 RepID=UPI00119E0F9F|nr:hypothetical protein [Cereibacter sediminicola]
MSASQNLFKQINNALLDLQQSDLQSYPAQVKKIGRLLQHEEIQPYKLALTANVDLGDFIAASERTQGGMVGSAELVWPDDDLQILGIKLLLIVKFSENPQYMAEFGYTFFGAGSKKMYRPSGICTG